MRKPCCDKEHNNRGAWSKQEDQKLIDYIQTHGEGCWRSIAKAAGLHRCGKSCRLRWTNYLRPDIKRGDFDQDEEDLIIKLHALLGNRWSLIAGRLPGRTDSEVKNYWNSHLKKKLMKMGIDPNNHRLNQVLPRPQPHYPPISSMYEPENCADDQENSDRVSETASCFEGESTSSSKLNLDLTIAVSKSPDRLDASETKQPNLELPTTCEVLLESKPVPTLLLFH